MTEKTGTTIHELHSHLNRDENEEQRSTYLDTDNTQKRISRGRDSEEQRNARLSYQRQRSIESRSSENEDQRSAPLNGQRKRSATNRLRKTARRKIMRAGYSQQHPTTTRSNSEEQHLVGQDQVMKIQRQQRVSGQRHQVLFDQYKWPSVIPTQLKEYCLQDFCDHTSMSVLRQSTCIVCNVRASDSTMKTYALRNIPNSEKLSCHTDLTDTISKISQSRYLNCRTQDS